MRVTWTGFAVFGVCLVSLSAPMGGQTKDQQADVTQLALDAGLRTPIAIVTAGESSALVVLNIGSGPQTVIVDTDGGCPDLAKQSLNSVATMYFSYGPNGEPPNSAAGARMLVLTDPIQICRITNTLVVSKEKPPSKPTK